MNGYKELFKVAPPRSVENFTAKVSAKMVSEKAENIYTHTNKSIYGLSAALVAFAVLAGGAVFLLGGGDDNHTFIPLAYDVVTDEFVYSTEEPAADEEYTVPDKYNISQVQATEIAKEWFEENTDMETWYDQGNCVITATLVESADPENVPLWYAAYEILDFAYDASIMGEEILINALTGEHIPIESNEFYRLYTITEEQAIETMKEYFEEESESNIEKWEQAVFTAELAESTDPVSFCPVWLVKYEIEVDETDKPFYEIMITGGTVFINALTGKIFPLTNERYNTYPLLVAMGAKG